MRCHQCGADNPDSAQFCQHCGISFAAAQPVGEMQARTSGLAIASFVMGLLCLTCVAWPLLFLPAILCGIIALVSISNNKGRLKGSGMAIAGIVIPAVMIVLIPIFSVLLAILMPAFSVVKDYSQQIECRSNLHALHIATLCYAVDYEDQFPTPESWCDLLIKEQDVSPLSFRCPVDPEGTFSYAMNRNLTGQRIEEVSPDTVLFFEANLGRNGVGGPEDLVLRHNDDGIVGCIIAFVDNTPKFVPEEEIDELRWEP